MLIKTIFHYSLQYESATHNFLKSTYYAIVVLVIIDDVVFYLFIYFQFSNLVSVLPFKCSLVSSASGVCPVPLIACVFVLTNLVLLLPFSFIIIYYYNILGSSSR